MSTIKVAVVDDHKLVREMWIKLLAEVKDIEVVAESGEFDEAIELIKQKKPDVVLLDINLKQSSGMDAVPLIRKFSPGTRIIGVSMHNQLSYAKKMLQMGAKAYVTKNSSHKEILKAIEEVMQGRTYICSEIKDIIAEHVMVNEQEEPKVQELSVREIEIIKLIHAGLSSKEIAEKLFLSVRTVEVHRHNILKKLKLNNTVSLINFVNSSDLAL